MVPRGRQRRRGDGGDPASPRVKWPEVQPRCLSSRAASRVIECGSGFHRRVLALWLAQPTERSLAAGAIVAARRRRRCASGRRGTSRKGARSRRPGRTASRGIRSILVRRIIGVGFAIAAASVAAACVAVAYLAITLTAAMRSEEAHLTEKFGTAYPAYREGRAPGGQRRFSMTRVMRIASIEPLRGSAPCLRCCGGRFYNCRLWVTAAGGAGGLARRSAERQNELARRSA